MRTYYKGTVAYDGTNYCGWQLQKDVKTIQEEIEKALSKIFNVKRVIVLGASRTDSGVHAHGQLFNFHAPRNVECDKLKRGLNSLLPNDIHVKSIEYSTKKYNSITKAEGKYYKYNYIYPPNPLKNNYAYTIQFNKPDFKLMKKGAKLFEGKKDYAAYRNQPKKKPNQKTICIIKKSELEIHNEGATLHIKGDRFLYNMIRIMAGTLLYIGYNKLTLKDIKKSFTEKKRKYVGKTLDASGLILQKVYEK